MRNKVLSIISGIVSLACVFFASGRAQAATSKAVADELSTCYDGCLRGYVSCTPTCCGILFCRKDCVIGCFQQLDGCDADCRAFCSTCDPDGAFDDTATIARDGRTVRIGGPLRCAEGATADIDVTITQGAGGAVATGHARVSCPDHDTSFTLDARTTAQAAFVPASTVHACGTARIHAAAVDVDSFQWCRDVTLLPQGVDLDE